MSPCEACHAGCCRSFAVPVTGADILRIARDRLIDFWEFVCRWEDPKGNIARNSAPHFYFADELDTPFVICLKHEASENFPETTKCRFLVEDVPTEQTPLGTARCGIYESRPAACRAFPAKFNETDELAVIYDLPTSGRAGNEHPAYSLCPREWEPADFDSLELLPALAAAKFEMQFFHQLALLWNQKRRSWNLFPDFLALAYSNRIVGRQSAANDETEIMAFPGPNDPPEAGLRAA